MGLKYNVRQISITQEEFDTISSIYPNIDYQIVADEDGKKIISKKYTMTVLKRSSDAKNQENQNILENEVTKLFLLTGQSNMAGRGTAVTIAIPSNAKAWRDSTQQFDVITTTTTNEWRYELAPSAVGVQEDTQAIYFAKKMAELYPNEVVGIIHVAQGSQAIDQWVGGARLYLECKAYVEAALATLDNKSKIDGILWHQGEADDIAGTPVNTYENNLNQLIGEFRSETWVDLDTPFFVGQIPATAYDDMQPAQLNVTNNYKFDNLFVEATQDQLIDIVHGNHDWAVEIGERNAVRYQAIQTSKAKLTNEWSFTSYTDLDDSISANNVTLVGTFDQVNPYLSKTGGIASYAPVTTPINIDLSQSFSLSFGLFKGADNFKGCVFDSSDTNFCVVGETTGWGLRLRSSTGNEIDFSIAGVDTSVFHHYVVTYDNTTYKLYIDSVFKTNGVPNGSPSTLILDRITGGYLNTVPLGGGIKYLRLFNDALTEDEIKSFV